MTIDIHEEVNAETEDAIEESPCNRWHCRNEKVNHMSGIDIAYLAMDIEEGVEVIWNEIIFQEEYKPVFLENEAGIRKNLDALKNLAHPNILKFHDYWIQGVDGPWTNYQNKEMRTIRVVFITEYTGGSGTLKDFLRRSVKAQPCDKVKNWTRWCNQILSSLHYMHSLGTIHGNLSTDTIFLQHQGLLKIGYFYVDLIRNYRDPKLSTKVRGSQNQRYFPDEKSSPAFDIYSFGVIAREMLIPSTFAEAELQKAETGKESIDYAASLVTYRQRFTSESDKAEFIELCLMSANRRPDAKFLLRHQSLFELSPLQILAAHTVNQFRTIIKDIDGNLKEHQDEYDKIIAMCVMNGKETKFTKQDNARRNLYQDLDRLLLDIQSGLYPVNGGAGVRGEVLNSEKMEKETEPRLITCPPQKMVKESEEKKCEEKRAAHIECLISQEPNGGGYSIIIDVDLAGPLKPEEKKDASRTPECKRHLETKLNSTDTPESIAQELADFAFISEHDVEVMRMVIEDQYKLVQNMVFTNTIPVCDTPGV